MRLGKPRARRACVRSDCKKPVENTPCADGELGTPPRKAKIRDAKRGAPTIPARRPSTECGSKGRHVQ
ncbi:hypothetical protein DIPPA_00947 [Diplonema papillatum]|nr:hypothetical protein DIPPA_00947 [Diplonema papillatum]